MKIKKTEKGITLIALIITIVVLLLLAVVAVSSIINNGVLEHSGNAAIKYNQSVSNEKNTIVEYENVLNNQFNSSEGSSSGESSGGGSFVPSISY